MSVILSFQGWSGDDGKVAAGHLARALKLGPEKAQSILEWLEKGKVWKFGTPVQEDQAKKAEAFFKKHGFQLNLLPVDKNPVAAPATPPAKPSSAQPTPPASAASYSLDAENFEMPGLTLVTEATPHQVRKKNDRRLLAFKKTPVFLTVLLNCITFGIYCIYWFLSRKDDFNRLDSSKKLSSGVFQLIFVLLCVPTALDLLKFFEVYTFNYPLITGLMSLAGIILYVVQSFRVRRIMLDHFDRNFSGLKMISGFLILTLSVFYLQYKINGIHDWYAKNKDEDEELKLNGDGLAWVFALLLVFGFPVALVSYGSYQIYSQLEEGGFEELTNSYQAGYQLGTLFVACSSYWEENGRDQDCTPDAVDGQGFGYSSNPDVIVTGSGTQATFYAEAYHRDSEDVYTINSDGEVTGGEDGEEDESYIFDVDVKK